MILVFWAGLPAESAKFEVIVTLVKRQNSGPRGLAHIAGAFRYSMAGAWVLLREQAARLECILMVLASLVFVVLGASVAQFVVLFFLFMGVLCVEALNTAIELIVDRTSPEISDYGRNAKDIGSFAVFCVLVIFCGYALFTAAQLTWLVA